MHENFEAYAIARLPTMLRTARAVCGDATLAEDLVQDVLINVHARWEAVAVMDSPDAYVRRMIVNQFFSWRRTWGRLMPRPDLPEPGRVPDLAKAVVERDELRSAIAALPDRQRVAIAMRYLLDLPDTEIAAALGCAQSTVRLHVARGLRRLRRSMDHGADPTDDRHALGVAPSTVTAIYVKRTS